MDPKRTALVLIEYQNDFTSEGGTGAITPLLGASVQAASRKADAARSKRDAGFL